MPRCSLDVAASTVSEASSTWPAALRVLTTALVTSSSTPTNPFAPCAALATLSEISTHDHHRGEPTMTATAYLCQLCSKTMFKPIPSPNAGNVIPLQAFINS